MSLKKKKSWSVYVWLGLTALRSDEVIDLMIKEYPGKHAEYSVILQERERQRIATEYSVSTLTTVSKTNYIIGVNDHIFLLLVLL